MIAANRHHTILPQNVKAKINYHSKMLLWKHNTAEIKAKKPYTLCYFDKTVIFQVLLMRYYIFILWEEEESSDSGGLVHVLPLPAHNPYMDAAIETYRARQRIQKSWDESMSICVFQCVMPSIHPSREAIQHNRYDPGWRGKPSFRAELACIDFGVPLLS